MGNNWWDDGGLAKPLPESDKPKGSGPWRFYLKADQSKRIVFIDDNCCRFREHNLKIGGKWGNFFTCIGTEGEQACPLCKSGDTPYLAGAFTVVDLSGYEKDGERKGKNRKYLFVAKYYTLEVLQKQFAKRNGLVGAVYEVTRTSANNAPSVGNVWDYEEKMDITGLPDTEIYKYQEVFKPRSMEEMCRASGTSESSAEVKTEKSSSGANEDMVEYD